MSIQSEIDRLNAIKERIRTNLVAQGVTVPEDTVLSTMAEQILSVAGEPGPNQVSTTTATNISGLLKGDGSSVSAATAGTDYTTPDNVNAQIQNLLGRTNAVNEANTNYTTLMVRGIKVVSADTSPGVNGAMSFTYST